MRELVPGRKVRRDATLHGTTADVQQGRKRRPQPRGGVGCVSSLRATFNNRRIEREREREGERERASESGGKAS